MKGQEQQAGRLVQHLPGEVGGGVRLALPGEE
jgi:hypothetical protein